MNIKRKWVWFKIKNIIIIFRKILVYSYQNSSLCVWWNYNLCVCINWLRDLMICFDCDEENNLCILTFSEYCDLSSKIYEDFVESQIINFNKQIDFQIINNVCFCVNSHYNRFFMKYCWKIKQKNCNFDWQFCFFYISYENWWDVFDDYFKA